MTSSVRVTRAGPGDLSANVAGRRARVKEPGIDLRTRSVARCPSCSAQSAGGRFCQECGSSLAAERTCESCSATNPASARFCSGCGTPSGA
ncbi:double zinc ribbon domain-containing protein [Cellulomonas flavigena]|uniref:double zinc ribbon domain-containing protein n=1 Tax=Cellulomonas flavigena TaxID=1711 RepID=UPI0016511ABD